MKKAPKTRRVFVTIELETSLPLSELRKRWFWSSGTTKCLQAQANVARSKK